MSLFPAYSEIDDAKKPSEAAGIFTLRTYCCVLIFIHFFAKIQVCTFTANDQSWLSLSNFPADLQTSSISNLSSDSSTEKAHSDSLEKKRKKKKHRHESKKHKMEKLLLEKA